jgi:hypothetical protein
MLYLRPLLWSGSRQEDDREALARDDQTPGHSKIGQPLPLHWKNEQVAQSKAIEVAVQLGHHRFYHDELSEPQECHLAAGCVADFENEYTLD